MKLYSMNKVDLLTKFLESFENSEWQFIDEIIDEEIEHEIVWNGITHKGKTDMTQIFKLIKEVFPSLTISLKEMIDLGEFSIAKCDGHHYEERKYKKFKMCFYIRWRNGKIFRIIEYQTTFDNPSCNGHLLMST